MDMAEHMFNKSVSSRQIFDPNTAESLADVLYEMGKDLLGKKQYKSAAKWLDRSLEILTSQELDRLSMDASELKLSIAESLVKSQLGTEDQEAIAKARDLIEQLSDESGDKLILLLLKLELSASAEVFESDNYADLLRRIIRSTILSAENFKLITYHIRKLYDNSPALANKILDEFLRLRILPEDKQDWVEKLLVTRLYMTIGQHQETERSNEALKDLEDLLSDIASDLKQPLSSGATLAAHAVSPGAYSPATLMSSSYYGSALNRPTHKVSMK